MQACAICRALAWIARLSLSVAFPSAIAARRFMSSASGRDRARSHSPVRSGIFSAQSQT
jgi:hypothetical protein